MHCRYTASGRISLNATVEKFNPTCVHRVHKLKIIGQIPEIRYLPGKGNDMSFVADPLECTLDKYSELMVKEQCFESADIFTYGRQYAVNVAYRDKILTVLLSTVIPGSVNLQRMEEFLKMLNQEDINGFYLVSENGKAVSVTYNQRVGVLEGIPERKTLEKILDIGIARIGLFLKRWSGEQWQEMITMNRQ